MGSPIGPTFANIFMCHLENIIINECPADFKPNFYKRYVDDTFALFHTKLQAENFFLYINNIHQNIKFTMETESQNKLAFLDILITRRSNKFHTSIYRKPTFTSLSTNFFSFVPINFKANAIKTLLYRAYHLCSTWADIHKEIHFLSEFFKANSFPDFLLPKLFNKFLNQVYQPSEPNYNVPKLKLHFSFPYLGSNLTPLLEKELNKTLSKLLPFVDFKFIFCNPLTIGSLFRFKDSIPELMRSNLVYLYKCPCCKQGRYVGCTQRRLQVRICSHRGISYRTHQNLTNKEASAPRDHALQCKTPLQFEHFQILSTLPSKNRSHLPILESLQIKHLQPNLNLNSTSTPLLIA